MTGRQTPTFQVIPGEKGLAATDARAQLRELCLPAHALRREAAQVGVANHSGEKKDERPQSSDAKTDRNGEEEGPRVVHRAVGV